MTTDPIKDFFEEAVPRSIGPRSARAEFAALSPGFRAGRRRHRIRMGATGAVCALGLIAGGSTLLAAVSVDSPSAVEQFATSGPGPEIGDAAESESFDNDVDPDDEDGDSGPVEVAESADPDDGAEADDVASELGSTGGPASSPGDAGDDSVIDEASDSSSSTEETEPAVEGDMYTGVSAGGTATVELVDGDLVFVGDDPAEGFTAEIREDESDEIKVEFTNGDVRYKVEFELHDGLVEINVSADADADADADEDADEDSDEDDDSDD